MFLLSIEIIVYVPVLIKSLVMIRGIEVVFVFNKFEIRYHSKQLVVLVSTCLNIKSYLSNNGYYFSCYDTYSL